MRAYMAFLPKLESYYEALGLAYDLAAPATSNNIAPKCLLWVAHLACCRIAPKVGRNLETPGWL